MKITILIKRMDFYDKLIEDENNNIDKKNGFSIVNLPPNEDYYSVSDDFCKRPAYKKRKQKSIKIGEENFPTIESQEKAKQNISYTEFEKENIRRKFKSWSTSNTNIGKLTRKIIPDKIYGKDELFNLIRSSGYKVSPLSIITHLQRETNHNNGYGIILQSLPGDKYRVVPELVYDYKRIILRQELGN